jgi:DsbC/DsbD-like thiol-disulfide interchange protein
MLMILAFLAAPVMAAENPLQVRMVCEVNAVSPGATFHVGFHLKHPEGYHSYWKHPGIVGLATSVKWSLPEGFEAGEIQWPAPKAVKMASYTAQGYHGETLLIVPMTAPESLQAGSVTLEAQVTWMCCKKACSPAHDVPFSITLPVADKAGSDPETSPMFEEARAKIARPDARWEARAKRAGDQIVLEMRPLEDSARRSAAELGALRFFTADGQVNSDEPQAIEVREDGSIRWELAWSEYGPDDPSGLPGVVQAAGGWTAGGPEFIEITASY